MKRFSVKTLFGVLAVAAIVVWWIDPGFHVIFDDWSPGHGRVQILGKRVRKTNQYKLRVKYTPQAVPAEEVDWSPVMTIEQANVNRLSFESLVDANTGIWCVYDTSGNQFVLLALPETQIGGNQGTFWHPGIHIGWARGLWIRYFKKVKESHPAIPYETLPSEMRLDPEQ